LARIELKVQPQSTKRDIVIANDGTIKVYLHSAPENNKANKELIKYLSDRLGISKSKIKIIRGLTSRNKTLEINEIDEERLYKTIQRA
jgi:uncharacterized protein (TIGR00251 family)